VVVGILEFKITVRQARSLKDKRRTLRSLKANIKNEFNVSVAEVDAQEIRQLAVMAAAHVGDDARYVRSTLDKLVDLVRYFGGVQLIDYNLEILHR